MVGRLRFIAGGPAFDHVNGHRYSISHGLYLSRLGRLFDVSRAMASRAMASDCETRPKASTVRCSTVIAVAARRIIFHRSHTPLCRSL